MNDDVTRALKAAKKRSFWRWPWKSRKATWHGRSFSATAISPTLAQTGYDRTGFAESTLAELQWAKRKRSTRWLMVLAVAMGLLAGVALFAPAEWLARFVASGTGNTLMLSDVRGTVWNGSGVVVLTGGSGSRDASALPGRLQWTLRPKVHGWGLGFEMKASQACCLPSGTTLNLLPGFGRFALQLPSAGAVAAPNAATAPTTAAVVSSQGPVVGQWPAQWLSGLGTPWNTLQLSGVLRMNSPGLTLEWVQGRARFTGELSVDLANVNSRVSTLPNLGSYRLHLKGDAATGDVTRIQLQTLDGALRLNGEGEWTPNGVHFRGEGTASEGSEAALDNLLNIIGRREGVRSVITIG